MRDTRTERRGRGVAMLLLVGYLAAVAVVAFWPVPVDRGASGFFIDLERLVPWATHQRIEFAANIVFFLPLGWLLALLLGRRRLLALPIGVTASATIELLQAAFLAERTATVVDVIANTIGTALGVLLAWATTRAGSRSRRPAARQREPRR